MFGETIKNFHINFNARDDRNLYSCGDLITGKLSFDLTKKMTINSITLTLNGKAHVSWRRGTRKHRRVTTANVEYFNLKNVIRVNAEDAVQSKLPPGTHVYPFACQIPQGDFPASFKGLRGRIVYSLLVVLDRPWHRTKEYITEFNMAPSSYTTPNYELMAPLSGTISKTLCCLWCASGPISMNVRLARKAFLPGEDITIMCEFSNGSSRTATPKARLVQKQMFYSQSRGHSTMHTLDLDSKAGDLVDPHSSDVQSELTLTVPSDTPFTISNCAILEVSYLIEMRLSVKRKTVLTVLCPIVIYNPPQYNVASPPHV
ncbi:hypothetical protein NHX12_034447 [Muraenolepis orangiensis]|uniref:Arrestin C-terminal-like domain-containing protein n=1 Tax=Muraenolepis orangiensis TaxID=630683 RepID=A0A9Q0D6L7_9TELE|nr:hypothetical protein NHX12_034447 [Muraenolepis orangiensis]